MDWVSPHVTGAGRLFGPIRIKCAQLFRLAPSSDSGSSPRANILWIVFIHDYTEGIARIKLPKQAFKERRLNKETRRVEEQRSNFR